MSEPVLVARGLTAGYFGQPAIQDVDLEVHPGEIVGVFGANGAGKTTTLLALAGEIKLLSGSIELLGSRHPGNLAAAARSGLALLTDDRGIFAPLTTRDNLRLGRGGVETALEYFPELQEHLDRRAGLLSGGQQQMLALARIFAAEPKVILADELSLGLAPLIVVRLLKALRDAADRGAAVLLVEQHLAAALNTVDRACVLVRGSIRLEAPAEELRRDPDRVGELYLAG